MAAATRPWSRSAGAAHRLFLHSTHLRNIRADALLAAALLIAAFAVFGSHWPLLLAFLAGRGALISIFDNVYHFGTPIDRPDYARNLALPRPLQLPVPEHESRTAFTMDGLHPWWALSGAARHNGQVYPDLPIPDHGHVRSDATARLGERRRGS